MCIYDNKMRDEIIYQPLIIVLIKAYRERMLYKYFILYVDNETALVSEIQKPSTRRVPDNTRIIKEII